jgi:hypothetical protein
MALDAAFGLRAGVAVVRGNDLIFIGAVNARRLGGSGN